MKKFTSLLLSCSLALAGAAMAQQPDEQASPNPKQAVEKGRGRGPETKPPGANEGKPRGPAAEQHRATEMPAPPNAQKVEEMPKQQEAPVAEKHGEKHLPTSPKMEKGEMTPKPSASVAAKPELSGEPAATAAPDAKKQLEERKNMKMPPAAAKPSATAATAPTATATHAAKAIATASPAATVSATPVMSATPAATASAAPSATVSATAAASAVPSVSAGQSNELAAKVAAAKKPDPQQVQQIKAQHANFHAQAKPELAPAVTFNANHRIEGSDRWQGQQYEVFRTYHPERHDEGWYRSRYSRVELIGGGYYYQNNGYWYPAWGYRPAQEYYAYDGPIYVGRRSEPPDQIIADVQAALQHTGYYKGEVDGLLGPLTRQALTAYQDDQGLSATAAIDEPTLDALGMGS